MMTNGSISRLTVLASLVLILILSIPGYVQAENPEITAGEIKSHIRYLASDELQGRESGTEGGEKAAAYIASHFRGSGLKPLGGGGTFFQEFTFISGVKLGGSNSFSVKVGQEEEELRVKDDFLPLAFSENGTVEGELVFAGYGITAPELDYDDYAGVDAKGKIVLVLRYTPGDYNPQNPFYRRAPLHYKARNAREKGAKGIVFVTPTSQEEEEDLGGIRFHSGLNDLGIHAVIVRREIAEKVLSFAGKEMKSLEEKLADKETASFVIPDVKARIRTDLIRVESSASNVIGLLEGSDPALKDEVIVVGAHYDHVGSSGEGSMARDKDEKNEIHNGADDNASGTAGLLELAEYFSGIKSSLKRSLFFIAFSGEEKGLLGSSYYIKYPEAPLDKTVAMFNMDMIGRLRDDLVVMGVGTSPAWEDLLLSANSGVGLSLKTKESGFAASDQTAFLVKDIPVLLFFTGIHPDYHTPGDDWEKINAEGEEKILSLIAGVIRELNRMPERIAFSKPEGGDNERHKTGAARFDVYLGTVPDYSEEVDGVKLMGVRTGSPAERAGLKEGDVIVNFAGKSVGSIYDYVYALSEAEAGVPAEIVILRDGERVKLNIVPESREQSSN